MTFPSKRSGINLHNGPSGPFEEHALVDMFRGGGQSGPFSTGWATGAMYNADNLDDTTGIPNTSGTRTRSFGGFGCYMPNSSQFSGKFVLTWDGDGEFAFGAGTWTVDTGLSSNYNQISNGRFEGINSYIVLTYTGSGGVISTKFNRHDRSNIGAFITAVHFYRLEDESRFLAGKVYRAGYLKLFVDLNPGFVRFMNWGRVNNSLECRYEHHNKSTRQWWGDSNHLACDTYGEITGTNQYAIADSSGSPAAMKHGEVVTGRVTNSQVRCGAKTVSAITKANPGVVTATAHGFNTGDIIVHRISAGMTQLNNIPCTITVDDADHYQLGIDTSAFSNFTAGTANQYITLNRGGHGDYPVVFEDGATPASNYGNAYIAAGDYKTFSFDKYHVASTLVTGAWIFSNLGSEPKVLGIAPEIMTQFMVELNEMQVAQSTASSPLGPTEMWVCVPHRGLLSVDPDYDAASHFGIGLIGDILNGANGYSGLPARCSLIIEGSNEDWNSGGTSFSQTGYQARLGFLRYGGSSTDYSSYSTIRKVILVNDLKAAFPNHPQLRYVICGQGSSGISPPNVARINGNSIYDNDAWNTWGGDPIDHFDGFGWAAYLVAGDTYDAANLATMAATYAAASTDAGREAACAAYVNGIVNSGHYASIEWSRSTLLPAYANEMANHGKITLNYEGGWDKSTTAGTDEVDAFMVACKKSVAWAEAWRYYLSGWVSQAAYPNIEAHAFYPSDYIMTGDRWGHCYPDTYANGIEGGNLDLAWIATGDYNRGLEALPEPTPTTTGGSGNKGRRGQIQPPPRIKWKKKPTKVAEVIEAVKQVAKVYPEYKMDFAEEWRHIANLLLADSTLAQLRKIESARELADRIAKVIEEDDEEVLLLM